MILSFGTGAPSGALTLPIALTVTSALALLAYLLTAAVPSSQRNMRAALIAGWFAHAAAIVVDIAGLGAPWVGARFGFAPAMSVTGWLVLAIYLIESRFVPIAVARRSLALLGAGVVVVAWLFPGEIRPHLASRWAPLHWVLGIASYGLFGAAVLHAGLLSRTEGLMRKRSGAAPVAAGLPLLQLERLTFRFVSAGFVLLTAALILGVAYADPWRWDHKAVFSVLGWLVFAGLLVGRRTLGWRGRLATRWVYVGAAILLLGYVGSRFVLEVVLHRGGAA